MSPDGATLYVVSLEDDAIARFTRNTANGKLAYKGCITGETQSGPAGSAALGVLWWLGSRHGPPTDALQRSTAPP